MVAATQPALAQQTIPPPGSNAPAAVPIPGVVPERFTLTPNATPTPTPTPSPTVTPSPTPRAVLTPVPIATPAARTPVTPPTPRATAMPLPVATAAPAAIPTPTATAQPPLVEDAPTPVVPSAMPPAAAPSQGAPWLWMLLGAAGAAVLALAGLWLLRRRREQEDYEPADMPVSLPAPPPPPVPVPPRPVAPRVPSAPAPVAPIAALEPFEVAIQPLAIQFGEHEILIDIEMLIANPGASAAEGARVAAVAISANPDQDAYLASFAASGQLASATDPFDLPAGGGGRMPIRLTLPRDAVHVVTVGARPMFVPMALIGIRWRAGLSVRSFTTGFMIGTGGQGGKLGPVWLDRPAPAGPLAATRYLPRAAVAA